MSQTKTLSYPPNSTKEETFIENAAKGLAQLANKPNASAFEHVLSTLFMKGYAGCSSSIEAEKNFEGLKVVRQFCEKIEAWAGAPLRELSAAKKLSQGKAVIDKAQIEINKLDGLPKFVGYEKDIIRKCYLQPDDKKSVEEFERHRIGRRTFLAASAVAVAGAQAKLWSSPDAPLTPAQTKEADAKREVEDGYSAITKTTYSRNLPEIKANINEAFAKQEKALKELEQATKEREQAGEPSAGEVQTAKMHRNFPYYATTTIFSGALMLAAAAKGFENEINNFRTGPSPKRSYENNMSVLHNQMLNAVSNELLNGTNALLENAAKTYAQQAAQRQ